MKERLFCDNWTFLKTDLACTKEAYYEKCNQAKKIMLPHDWLIYQVDDLYEDSIGWYRKEFSLDELSDLEYASGDAVWLSFDGVYMNCEIYVNQEKAFEWKYGYSAFQVDITKFLKSKSSIDSIDKDSTHQEYYNEILVKVVHQAPNSRWYSGAGIYRDVRIRVCKENYLPYYGTYVSTNAVGDAFDILVETEVVGTIDTLQVMLELVSENQQISNLELETSSTKIPLVELESSSERIPHAEVETSCACSLPINEKKRILFKKRLRVEHPKRWSVDDPNCYNLQVKLIDANGNVWDEDSYTIGFKTCVFDPEKGFFLNGKHLKLNGVCEHHDLGCLGAAFNIHALERRFSLLRQMGVNAIRTSHNMPAKELMELANREGFLIISEAFDMWEYQKTEFDYARFFNDWVEKDVASWIRRDRNHPSLLMWSIGNEIYDTHAGVRGMEITKMLMKLVREHDPKQNAKITLGSNYMPWENTQKCADLYKLVGYNYAARLYAEHHREHPDWMIYGSETASVVHSRGVYHFPYKQAVLSDEDEQCSALGNSNTSWGAKNVETCIAEDRDQSCSMGQFIWTGFDYIGEPTPYHTKNSYFGQLDTAGFAKDPYFIYQAEWTDVATNPMVHLFPYWDFNEGQLIDVRACSNGERVELFVNGISKGVQALNHSNGTDFTALWQVPYESGEIIAVAYDHEGKEIARQSRHSFGDAKKIIIKQDVESIPADLKSLCHLEISVLDKDGYPVENAMDYINISVNGPLYLVGMDNGDSTDYEPYKSHMRKLFNGKLLAVFQAGTSEGTAQIAVTGEGLEPAFCEVTLTKANILPGIGTEGVLKDMYLDCQSKWDARDCVLDGILEKETEKKTKQIPARKVEITVDGNTTLTKVEPETIIHTKIYPEAAEGHNVIVKAVNIAGIEIDFVEIDVLEKNKTYRVRAVGDGAFRLRAMAQNQEGKIKLISQMEMQAEGIGTAYMNPYEFITAGLFTDTFGEVGNGNEKGIATARGASSGVLFENVNFGAVGADEITIPVFALSSDAFPFQIYEGTPDNGELLLDAVYQKPSIWNVYQAETYKLRRRIRGITSISILFHDKVHVKGFSFEKIEKAFEPLMAAECTTVYGDQFDKKEQTIESIGNNVTVSFDEMDFGTDGAKQITICGRTNLNHNTIHLHFEKDTGETIHQILEFVKTKDYEEQTFTLDHIDGKGTVRFVFLPGSQFDFKSFIFKSIE